MLDRNSGDVCIWREREKKRLLGSL